MTSYISGEKLTKLKQNVHLAARDNRAFHMYTVLCNYDHYSVVKEVVSHRTEEDGQWATPLLIASINGHDNAAHVLIGKFNADVNDTGRITVDGQIAEDVTPLWCAAAIGNYGMVKYLIGHGANVNKPTKTRSTPLRAACFSGFMDIIKHLINADADISISNRWNNSCLMLTCYKGHTEAVTILLKKGALVNQKDYQGSTALHLALEQDHVEIAKLLLNSGSKNSMNHKNINPLKIAAYNCHAEIVELLIIRSGSSKLDKIEAYELLGASFANNTNPECSKKAYSYLRKGMAERLIDPLSIVQKILPDPQLTFENHVECRTLAELDAIKDDDELLDKEALVVRDRILGDHSDVIEHITYRGAVFADDAHYNKCLTLWLYALTLRQRKKESASFDLTEFVIVFIEMVVKHSIKNNLNQVLNVLKCAIDELKFDKVRIDQSDGNSFEDYINKYEQNIHTCLYLLIILVKISKSPTDTNTLHALVCMFVQLNPRLRNQETPLHLATNEDTKVDDRWKSGIIVFPNYKVAKLLVDCGADINVKNSDGHIPQLDNDM